MESSLLHGEGSITFLVEVSEGRTEGTTTTVPKIKMYIKVW